MTEDADFNREAHEALLDFARNTLKDAVNAHRIHAADFDLSGVSGQNARPVKVNLVLSNPYLPAREELKTALGKKGLPPNVLSAVVEKVTREYKRPLASHPWQETKRQGNVTLTVTELPIGSHFLHHRHIPKDFHGATINGREVAFTSQENFPRQIAKFHSALSTIRTVEKEKNFSFHPVILFQNHKNAENNVKVQTGAVLQICGEFLDMALENPHAFKEVLLHERGHKVNGDLDGNSLSMLIDAFAIAPIQSKVQRFLYAKTEQHRPQSKSVSDSGLPEKLDLGTEVIPLAARCGTETFARRLSDDTYSPGEAIGYVDELKLAFTGVERMVRGMANIIRAYPDIEFLDHEDIAATCGQPGGFEQYLASAAIPEKLQPHALDPIWQSATASREVDGPVRDSRLYAQMRERMSPIDDMATGLLADMQLIVDTSNMLRRAMETLADLEQVKSSDDPQRSHEWIIDRNRKGTFAWDQHSTHPTDWQRKIFYSHAAKRLERLRKEPEGWER